MGANLGTTFSGWMIALLGFSVNIEQLALPLAGISGIALLGGGRYPKLFVVSQCIFGFSLLFVGLGFMKESVDSGVMQDFMAQFSGSPALVFLCIGFILTGITQSSSATVAITLSFLHAGSITLEQAMAVVIGSEAGTALKLVAGALDGVAIKKRISAGNLLYNIATTLLAFAVLHPAAQLIAGWTTGMNPLFGLTLWQTGMNLMSMLLFFPFINPLSAWLEKRFLQKDAAKTLVVGPRTLAVGEGASELLFNEVAFFFNQSKVFIGLHFNLRIAAMGQPSYFASLNEERKTFAASLVRQYEQLKAQYGIIQSFYLRMQSTNQDVAEFRQMERLINVARSAMHAAKCIRDLEHDFTELNNAVEPHAQTFLRHMEEDVTGILHQLTVDALSKTDGQELAALFQNLLKKILARYRENVVNIYTLARQNSISDLQLATMMNFNREVFTAEKSLVMSAKELLLPVHLADTFNDLPTYAP